jgi:hypothetical protein
LPFFLNDSSQSAGHRMWGLRTVNSGRAFQIAAENDDGSAQNAGLQVNRNGTVAIANSTGASGELAVQGGLQSYTTAPFPTCDSTHRGEFFLQQGASGVKDSAAVCAKDASNTYAWAASGSLLGRSGTAFRAAISPSIAASSFPCGDTA